MTFAVTFLDQHSTAVLVAFIGAMAPVLVLVIKQHYDAKKIQKVAEDINDAVNHRHARTDVDGEPPPKLYDLVLSTAKTVDDNRARIGFVEKQVLSHLGECERRWDVTEEHRRQVDQKFRDIEATLKTIPKREE